jgi:hypothetical protein
VSKFIERWSTLEEKEYPGAHTATIKVCIKGKKEIRKFWREKCAAQEMAGKQTDEHTSNILLL